MRWFALATLGVVAVAVSGWLALEAWRATQRHRAAAEGALRDQANFAALNFRTRFIDRAWIAADAVFRPVGHPGLVPPGAPLPPLSALAKARRDEELCYGCGPPLHPRYYFRLILADTSLEVTGRPLPSTHRAHIVAGVLGIPDLHQWRHRDYTSIVDTMAPGTDLIYLTARRGHDGRLSAIYGFAIPLETVAARLLRPALDQLSLLPVAGTHRYVLPRPHLSPNDSLLSVTVLRPNGTTAINLSPHQYPDDYSSRIHGSRLLGGWTIRVALNPQAATRLLVGGLPSSRKPLLVLMVLFTAILIATSSFAAWRALELARLRSEFVANVSHELRTPLAQILLFGESLKLGRMHLHHDVQSAGRIIVSEAQRLMRLVDNIMLFGRAVRLAPRPATPEALAPLLDETVRSFAPIAAAASSRVLISRLDNVAAPVDRGAMRQVLLNLLDNAVKYGPSGQTVSLGLAYADGNARLWVEDEGPGIPPPDRERVWHPFVRLARDVDGQKAGSGIGLSLVREIVTRHRGTARIEATPAGGTRIVVELPDARPMQAEVPCAS